MNGGHSEHEFVASCITRALEDLPAMPGIIIRVLEETDKNEPSSAVLEAIISSDQAIASKVLRVVNSAYYGVQARISSVGQAVVILGTKQVRNLVLSAAAMSALPARTHGQMEALRSFWTHSYATATTAQLIAKYRELAAGDAETVFVGGLLHDIGRLFMLTHFPHLYDDAIARAEIAGGRLEEFEADLFGASHSEIGAAVAEKWRLPEPLVQIVRRHEGPFEEDEQVAVLVVHCADVIAKSLFGNLAAIPSFDIDPVAQDWLRFGADEFMAIREEASERVEQASDVFGLLSAA